MNELVSRSTRGLFRDLMTGSSLGAIGAAFQDEGFAPNSDCRYEDSSSRGTLTQEYLEAVDWTDVEHVRRVLRVFERLMHGHEPEYTRNLINALRRDGYVDDETGHITQSNVPSTPDRDRRVAATRRSTGSSPSSSTRSAWTRCGSPANRRNALLQ